MSVGILLADDHKIMREGLMNLLQKQPSFEVVGEADNGRTALELACRLKPDIVIMDISMPELNGIEATRKIGRELPDTKVIALSMHFDKRYIARMLDAGARGYLRKACASEEVVRAITVVVSGKYYISDGVTSVTVKQKEEYLRSTPLHDISTLTPKEREVLQLIAEGRLTKEIADLLEMSVKTAEKHRGNIMEKLNIHSIAELTKFAIIEGITSLER